ncbi:7,8-didemethyl-8-hydroxy-5-deazariboflavin synthase subunit CofG [Methanolobus sediminis]|uniref:7,8-didemethyl-8-hydroxy-5-deazariboflavin synthase n=1 Tax=Methanolobus sediminis TaxID=3072978 RepID=A0AA51UJ26_9EURY|nr:7,8-didemethyl-8-hydroxy-5-deazariboflavin synthase subunit CofG [Methanolobus sediminis]WMW24457.1 7,8-didemethyl-8-hydroxy-5-deazariboflavin synthase subunit CofG [Methanolobus sediminis]
MDEFVTFCRNVFVPVTNICRNKCRYCTFRCDPDDPDAKLMKIDEILPILEDGKKAGCTEVLFTFGEYAEEVPRYKEWLEELGYSKTVDYIYELCKVAINTGLLPHTNAGVLNYTELEKLKPLNASMGLMLETTADVAAHEGSPGKIPSKRIKTIRYAGELHIPFTTGILIGIGETLDDRINSLITIAELHEEYGHIQEVIIQNFTPKPDTPMADMPSPTDEEMMQAILIAREILPDDIAIQVAPNLIDPYILIQCGASDLGGISPTTIDWINPEAEWPSVSELKEMVHETELKERLPIYPQYIKKGWYSENLKDLINSLADDDGYRKL